MRRVAAAVILLSVAFSIAVWTGYVFDREMNAFEDMLNELVAASDTCTREELTAQAEKIAHRWDRSSGLLRSVVLHEGVDELGRNISSLPQIIMHSDTEEMKIKCIEAINLIKNLKACEKVSFENVL